MMRFIYVCGQKKDTLKFIFQEALWHNFLKIDLSLISTTLKAQKSLIKFFCTTSKHIYFVCEHFFTKIPHRQKQMCGHFKRHLVESTHIQIDCAT